MNRRHVLFGALALPVISVPIVLCPFSAQALRKRKPFVVEWTHFYETPWEWILLRVHVDNYTIGISRRAHFNEFTIEKLDECVQEIIKQAENYIRGAESLIHTADEIMDEVVRRSWDLFLE